MIVPTVEQATASGQIQMWYRDPLSCLQATIATVLLHAGADPLPVLGLGWEFRYVPGDVRPEEFYYPCHPHGDLVRSLAPHHPVASNWWRPAGGGDPLEEIVDRLRRNELVIAAVDNYHLPFRPAFRDVHAAHLLVVYGVDRRAGEVHVSDAMPPAFQGGVPIGHFLRAWDSENPADVQDAFFSDARIGRRCLSVRLTAPMPPIDHAALRGALRANLRQLTAHGPENVSENGPENGSANVPEDVPEDVPPAWTGLGGLRRYVDHVTTAAEAGAEDALAEVYPFGWGMQAQSYLHGELLARYGLDWRVPELCEAGRAVTSVAYAWTGVRLTAAHGRTEPARAAGALTRHATRLRQRYVTAAEAVQRAADAL
jgi:hypothetical protein